MSNSLWLHGLQHVKLPCPSLSPRVFSNSCPLSWWYYPTISSSVIPFSSCPQFFQHQGPSQWVGSSHHVAKVEASVSASVLPVNIQGWFCLGLTALISLLSKALSRVFTSITILKHCKSSVHQYKIKTKLKKLFCLIIFTVAISEIRFMFSILHNGLPLVFFVDQVY